MKEFFAGRNEKLLTEETQITGVRIWKLNLEEKEMKHMTGRLDECVNFLYVADGTLVCQINQEKEEVGEGECLFINKGNAYRFVESGRGGVKLVLVSVEKEYVEADEMVAKKYVAPVWENNLLFSLKLDSEADVSEIMEMLEEAAQEQEDGYELEIRSLILRLWRALYIEVRDYKPSVKKAEIREKAKLCQMLEFIHSHYKEKITLSELAESAGISTGEYCRFFKKKMERTPFEYLQAYRIEQSIPEILEKSDTISNIALRHGFTGSSYFTETFKKEMGCAPGDYRKWYKGEMEKCPLKEVEAVEKPSRKAEEHISVRRTSMPAHLL